LISLIESVVYVLEMHDVEILRFAVSRDICRRQQRKRGKKRRGKDRQRKRQRQRQKRQRGRGRTVMLYSRRRNDRDRCQARISDDILTYSPRTGLRQANGK